MEFVDDDYCLQTTAVPHVDHVTQQQHQKQ